MKRALALLCALPILTLYLRSAALGLLTLSLLLLKLTDSAPADEPAGD